MPIQFFDIEGKSYVPESLDQVKFRPGVYAFVLNSKNELLMIVDERSGKWELPGGGLDICESLLEGVVREVKEETGYDISVPDEQPFFVEDRRSYYRRKKKFVHALNMYFVCALVSETRGEQNFAEGENILEVKFVPLKDVAELDIAPNQRTVIEHFLAANL